MPQTQAHFSIAEYTPSCSSGQRTSLHLQLGGISMTPHNTSLTELVLLHFAIELPVYASYGDQKLLETKDWPSCSPCGPSSITYWTEPLRIHICGPIL